MEPLLTSVNVHTTVAGRQTSTDSHTTPLTTVQIHRRRGSATTTIRASAGCGNVLGGVASSYSCDSSSSSSKSASNTEPPVTNTRSGNVFAPGPILTVTASRDADPTKRPTPSRVSITTGSATHDGGNRYQEDRVRIITSSDGGVCVGLFDGHGGTAAVSQMCHDKLPEYATASLGTIIPSLDTFSRHMSGGSTASIVRVSPDGLVEVERVGDSDVRLYNLAGPSDGIPLPEDDHSCTSVAEYRRIVENGSYTGTFNWYVDGMVIPHWTRTVFTKDGAGNWELNPLGGYQYCNIHKEWTAYLVTPSGRPLAMTRAIGDNDHRPCGLISTPATATHQLQKGTRTAIIVASDGLWDIFPLADAYTVVGRPELFGNAQAAADELLRLGLERGHAAWGPVIDNITIAVIFIDIPAPIVEPVEEPTEEPTEAPVLEHVVTDSCDGHPIKVTIPKGMTVAKWNKLCEINAQVVQACHDLDKEDDSDDDSEDGTNSDLICHACGTQYEVNGWAGLCDRGCYYDLRELHYDYESGTVATPDPRVVAYFTAYPDGGGHLFADPIRILAYIATQQGEATGTTSGEASGADDDEENGSENLICYACGSQYEVNGWAGLCDRGCYYDLRELHYDYESGSVATPDPRVVAYFTAYPDGGGHLFADPDRILAYIATQQGEATGTTSGEASGADDGEDDGDDSSSTSSEHSEHKEDQDYDAYDDYDWYAEHMADLRDRDWWCTITPEEYDEIFNGPNAETDDDDDVNDSAHPKYERPTACTSSERLQSRVNFINGTDLHDLVHPKHFPIPLGSNATPLEHARRERCIERLLDKKRTLLRKRERMASGKGLNTMEDGKVSQSSKRSKAQPPAQRFKHRKLDKDKSSFYAKHWTVNANELDRGEDEAEVSAYCHANEDYDNYHGSYGDVIVPIKIEDDWDEHDVQDYQDFWDDYWDDDGEYPPRRRRRFHDWDDRDRDHWRKRRHV